MSNSLGLFHFPRNPPASATVMSDKMKTLILSVAHVKDIVCGCIVVLDNVEAVRGPGGRIGSR